MAGIILAFKNYKVYPKNPTFWSNLIHSKWVGFDNFKFLFSSKDTLKVSVKLRAYRILYLKLI